MLLQLASADSRIVMATPQESLYPLHSGGVQHSVIVAAAPLEECADGGITAQPTSIKLGWRKAWQRRWPRVAHRTRRKNAQSGACGHVAKSVTEQTRRFIWNGRDPKLGSNSYLWWMREMQPHTPLVGEFRSQYGSRKSARRGRTQPDARSAAGALLLG
jgi:hypothetical protein